MKKILQVKVFPNFVAFVYKNKTKVYLPTHSAKTRLEQTIRDKVSTGEMFIEKTEGGFVAEFVT